MPDDILTLAEAAKALGLAQQTLRIQAKAGRLRARKLGPMWVTTAAAVNEYRLRSLRGSREDDK